MIFSIKIKYAFSDNHCKIYYMAIKSITHMKTIVFISLDFKLEL